MIDIPEVISHHILVNIMDHYHKISSKRHIDDSQNLLILQSDTTIIEDFIQPMSYMILEDGLTEYGKQKLAELSSEILDSMICHQLYIIDIDIAERSIVEFLDGPYEWYNIMQEAKNFKKSFVDNVHLNIHPNVVKLSDSITSYNFSNHQFYVYPNTNPSYAFSITYNSLKDDRIVSITATLSSNKIYSSHDLFWFLASFMDDIPICKKFIDNDISTDRKIDEYIQHGLTVIDNILSCTTKNAYIKRCKKRLGVLNDIFDEGSIEQIKEELMQEFNEKCEESTPEKRAICMNILHDAGIIDDVDSDTEIKL